MYENRKMNCSSFSSTFGILLFLLKEKHLLCEFLKKNPLIHKKHVSFRKLMEKVDSV